MLNLIKKDFCVQKKTFLLAVFYSAFVFVAFHTMRQAAYIMGSLAIAYLFIMNANYADDKNRSEILINSLPIDKEKNCSGQIPGSAGFYSYWHPFYGCYGGYF